MKQHHTKNKGDIGVLKSQIDLYEKGYFVCIPLTEHGSFDLVIVKDKERKTVQVKSKSLKNGKLEIPFRQSSSDKRGVHTKHWNKEEIDIYVFIVLIQINAIISTQKIILFPLLCG
jgi:hypothetical protein